MTLERLMQALQPLLACTLLAFTLPAQSETAKVAVGDWQPMLDAKMDNGGPLAQFIVEAFANQGVEAKVDVFPWKRALQVVKAGRYDMVPGYFRTEEREPYYYFSDTLWEARFYIYHKKDFTFDWNSLDDLKAYQIGVANGYGYSKEFSAAMEEGAMKLQVAQNTSAQFRMLLAGRVQIAPGSPIELGNVMQKIDPKGMDKLARHTTPLAIDFYRALFSKNERGQMLMDKFNEGMKALRASGRYQELIGQFDESDK